MFKPRRIYAAAIAIAAAMVIQPASAEAAPAGCTGPASATWIDVVVEGVESSSGLVAVTLYTDNSRKFLAKRGSLYVGRVPARAGTTKVCIFVPTPAVYAFAVYHDADSSTKFNRNGLGLPAEGYGFSNNPTTVAGLPAFRSVRLNVARTGLSTRVRLKYP